MSSPSFPDDVYVCRIVKGGTPTSCCDSYIKPLLRTFSLRGLRTPQLPRSFAAAPNAILTPPTPSVKAPPPTTRRKCLRLILSTWSNAPNLLRGLLCTKGYDIVHVLPFKILRKVGVLVVGGFEEGEGGVLVNVIILSALSGNFDDSSTSGHIFGPEQRH